MEATIPFYNVRALVLDVDGVFTDSRLLVTETGELLRRMNTRDGLAIKLALQAGLKVAVITGGTSEGVRLRLQGLGVLEIAVGVDDKLSVLEEYKKRWKMDYDKIAYMGDDLPDIECMKVVGVGCCPQDAVEEILSVAHYVSPVKGGYGCVRDVVEQILKAQDKWPVI